MLFLKNEVVIIISTKTRKGDIYKKILQDLVL